MRKKINWKYDDFRFVIIAEREKQALLIYSRVMNYALVSTDDDCLFW